MGKPFKIELLSIEKTIEWAAVQDISILRDFFEQNSSLPLLSIGSGGSLSACHYACLLYENSYSVSKALTPLDLVYSKKVVRDSKVLFISASGKNSDIQFAFKKSQVYGSKMFANICMKCNNPLEEMSRGFSNSYSVNFESTTGKDGFLATNSLVSFFVLLYRSLVSEELDLLRQLSALATEKYIAKYHEYSYAVRNRPFFTVLYGGWGLPVAFDVESKFTEAALGAVQLSDYRNFGHGRHHWFDKRKETSSIIAIVTPQERKIAEKTLSLIPPEIPRLIIDTEISSSLGSLDLLIKSFYLVDSIGDIRGIDPGKPGVPDFGSKLYHLNCASFYKNDEIKTDIKTKAILKKAYAYRIEDLSIDELNKWSYAYDAFRKKIQEPNYSTIIFDYDGTLTSRNSENRFTNELSQEVKDFFVNILSNRIKIGIVTGRGKSIKELLRNSISQIYWSQIFIGYYNGAEVSSLSDDSAPDTSICCDSSLKFIEASIHNEYFLNKDLFDIDLRPYQLTLKAKSKAALEIIKSICAQIILINKLQNVIIIESSHSLDVVVRPKVSKLNIIERFFENDACLCIGDKGLVPGNDFELLSTPFSLSVDEVSSHPDSCWNLIPTEKQNREGLLYYLNNIQVFDGYFKFNIGK